MAESPNKKVRRFAIDNIGPSAAMRAVRKTLSSMQFFAAIACIFKSLGSKPSETEFAGELLAIIEVIHRSDLVMLFIDSFILCTPLTVSTPPLPHE